MDDILGFTNPAPLSLAALTVNMLISILLTSIVAWYYTQYGRSLSNRARFAQILPLLAMIMVLIISVVKSSLALSLGLVGALSIVRFRTAIKEPEELMYLFIAIAIGLGLGADQRWPTIVAIAIILGFLIMRTFTLPKSQKNSFYLNVATADHDGTFAQINNILTDHLSSANLRRLDSLNNNLQATYLIHCPDEQTLITLLDSLRQQLPDSEFSFIEQDNTLGV